MLLNYDELAQFLSGLLEDMKAEEISLLDVRTLTEMTDMMFVATGRSRRHVSSIVDHLIVEAKQQKVKIFGVEGKSNGDWVLVDFGDALVHVMQSQSRSFFQLERLWTPLEPHANIM